MQQLIRLIIGIFVLILGVPIGNLLAKATNEELRMGKKWFQIIIILSLVGACIFLIIGNDVLFFTLLFIAVVTSRSLKR